MAGPLVGVMPLWDEEKHTIWMLPGYMDAVARAGGLPIILPFPRDGADADRITGMCGAFLFTGGQDVSPRIYGAEPPEGLTEVCPKRDRMEQMLLPRVLKADKPVLGICRGLQFINAFLGGTLWQDLNTQHPSAVGHRQRPPYDIPVHTVRIVRGSPLHALLGTDSLRVNSCHHQAVRCPAPGLLPMAFSPDGLAEAAYMPNKRFVWAVQWHPEFTYASEDSSRRIFEAFIGAAASPDASNAGKG